MNIQNTVQSTNDRLASWQSLLRDALLTPGVVHSAYTRFHGFSLRNMLLAMAQCSARGITPGPLATFRQWTSMGRFVVRGQKALTLCMPLTLKREPEDDTDAEDSRTVFIYRSRWFALSQTHGAAYQPVALPAWAEDVALQALDITRVPFTHENGNAQGYSTARQFAINPVAALPHKTLFHELGHIILGHTQHECTIPRHVRELEAESVALLCIEALQLPGTEYARGYLQRWATSNDLTDDIARRVLHAADTILRAGRGPPA
jgi:antirestriction protein ArdC